MFRLFKFNLVTQLTISIHCKLLKTKTKQNMLDKMFKGYTTLLRKCECLCIWNSIFMMFVFMEVINATTKALSSRTRVEATFLFFFLFLKLKTLNLMWYWGELHLSLSTTHPSDPLWVGWGWPPVSILWLWPPPWAQPSSWACLCEPPSLLCIHTAPAWAPVGFPL